MFEKLWQFSSYVISKGFKILEVSNADNFQDGNIEKVDYDTKHIFLRANQKGKPTFNEKIMEDKYMVVYVEGKEYCLVKQV